MKIISMSFKSLFMSFISLSLFFSSPAYSETSEISTLINKHDKLILLLKKHKDKAALSELTSAWKYKISNIEDFSNASKAFSASKRHYEKALEDLTVARSLIKKGISSENGKLYLEQGKSYIDKGLSSCSEGMEKFKAGLNFLNNAKGSRGVKVKTSQKVIGRDI